MVSTLKLGVSRLEFLKIPLLVFNAFTWYSGVLVVLSHIVDSISMTAFQITVFWVIHFLSVSCAALVGAKIVNQLVSRKIFVSLWMLLGVLSSLTPIVVGTTSSMFLATIFVLLGVAFGLGMPSCLAYYAESTVVEKRGRLGGLIFFAVSIGLFLVAVAMPVFGLVEQILILSIWRGFGLIAFLIPKRKSRYGKVAKSPSYATILRKKPLRLYLIPWVMFCLVNFLTQPIFPPNIVRSSALIALVITSFFALLGGLLSDFIGRKRVIIVGFVIFGFGYGILGIFSGRLDSYYVFTVAEGIAWGMLGPVFIMTLWGDLSENMLSEKYYAIGSLPYFLSGLFERLIAPYIREMIPTSATFSFASLFLFLAVLPLLLAPETLPEKKIRERQLIDYIKRAKRIKEKYEER